MKRASLSYLTGRENDAGELAQEPLAGEASDGCEGGGSEAHDHVGDGHVDHEQVDPGVKTKKMVWTEGYKEVGNDSQETFNSEKQFKNKTRNSSSAILSV